MEGLKLFLKIPLPFLNFWKSSKLKKTVENNNNKNAVLNIYLINFYVSQDTWLYNNNLNKRVIFPKFSPQLPLSLQPWLIEINWANQQGSGITTYGQRPAWSKKVNYITAWTQPEQREIERERETERQRQTDRQR